MSVYLAPLASGLGDAIVTLPLIYKSIETDKTFLVARSPRQEGLLWAIEGLAGIVREPDLETKIQLTSTDRYINLRLHPLQTDHIWGSEQFKQAYPDFRISNILQAIGKDFGYDIDLQAKQKLRFNYLPDFSNKIIIVPGTTVRSKTWPASNWLLLKMKLEALGHQIWMVGEPERSPIVRELIEAGVDWQPTSILQSAIDIISSSRLVVSVDTGLMHVAVQQDIPTVVMFQGDQVYYRPFSNCYPLFAQNCPPACNKAFEESAPHLRLDFKEYVWNHASFDNCFAEAGASCMESLTPRMVLDQVEKALSTTSSAVVYKSEAKDTQMLF